MGIVGSIVFGNRGGSGQATTNPAITDPDGKYVATTMDGAITEIGETKTWNGYDLYRPETWPDLSWDDSTRTFTFSVKAGSPDFHFWADGKKVIKTASESIQIADVTGSYYFWHNNAGVLQGSLDTAMSLEAFYQYALCGGVYWNAEWQQGLPGSELHGKDMDSRTHMKMHSTLGATYGDGFLFEGLTAGGKTHGNLTAGSFWDEDIHHVGLLQASLPWLYRIGANGGYRLTVPDTDLAYDNGGSYRVYNYNTGTEWVWQEGTSSTDYWVNYVMFMPSLDGNLLVKVPGQNGYRSRSVARDAINSELKKMRMDGLPLPEFGFIYAYIVNRSGKLQKLEDDTLYLDWTDGRGTGGSTASVSPSVLQIPIGSISVAVLSSFRSSFLMSLRYVRASVEVAPSGSSIIIDILIGGTSMFGTNKLVINDGDLSSYGNTIDYDTTLLDDDSLVEIEVTQVGSGTVGDGLVVYFVY